MEIRMESNTDCDINYVVVRIDGKILKQKNSYGNQINTANPRNTPDDIAVIYEKGVAVPYSITYRLESVKTVSVVSDPYGKYKTYLKDMGFYDGAIDEAYDDEFRRALICFQKAYGSRQGYSQVVDISGGIPASLKNWIQDVGAAFYTNLHNGKSTAAMKALGVESSDFEKKRNFARIWTFLEKGMGCTAHQAAGALGNIMQESNFSSLSENSVRGTIGILQWKGNRRKYLINFTEKHGYNEKNMGIQLAYFKYEVSSTWGKDHLGMYAQNSNWVDGWKKFMADCKTDYDKAAVNFMNKIEGADGQQEAERRLYAKQIYSAIK